MDRRLAAILAADIVGYTRIMSHDEAGTVHRLQERFRKVYVPTVEEFRGRMFKTMGDGFLAEFSSAIDAVACAEALQDRNTQEDQGLDQRRHMRLRIGVSLGDIFVEGADVFGTGVNIAARLQGMAGTDGICITAAVSEQVRNHTKRRISNRGPQRLHNFDEEVFVFDLLTESVPSSTGAPQPQRRDQPSIAVLPLDDLQGDHMSRLFADGVSEDIITELSRFRSLTVIARNSSFRYRGGNTDLGRVQRELGVQFVLEGSIQRQAEQVRITVQLISLANQSHVWANRYDFPTDSVFSVRDDITRSIVRCVSHQVDHALIIDQHSRNFADHAAYELYLRGADAHERLGMEGYAEAKRLYQESIVADRSFCRPHAGLAEIFYVESIYEVGTTKEQLRKLALEHARRAVELDEQEAHGHAILGFVSLYSGYFSKAARSFSRACELNPNDADIAMLRASQLAHMGDFEDAVESAKSALETNPFHPEWYFSELSVIYCLSGRYREAFAYAELVEPAFPHSPAWRAIAYAKAGMDLKAKEATEQFVEGMRSVWKGKTPATPADFAEWFLDFVPVSGDASRESLREGLRAAGLFGQSMEIAASPCPGSGDPQEQTQSPVLE